MTGGAGSGRAAAPDHPRGRRAAPLASYGHRPDTGELSLLRAALGRGPLDAPGLALAGRAAAGGAADQGAARLLPLLRDAPAASSLPADLRTAAEVAYRRAQARFIRLERDLATIVALLDDEAGIPALLLKGYPLARTRYASPAHRPMTDLDLAVPPDRLAEAAALLARHGLRPREERQPLAVGPGTHALTLVGAAGAEVDLHRNVLFASRWAGADDGFWARAVPVDVRGRPAVTLSAPDQVLHACLHGYAENVGPRPLRWMADVLAVLGPRGLRAAEWSVLLAEAGRHRCEGVLAAALAFVAGHLDAPVPVEVLEGLAAAPARPADEAFFRFMGRLPARFGLAWRLEAAWRDYRRRHDGTRPPPAAPGFPGWVAVRWGAGSAAAFARELARRLPRHGQP